MPVKRPTPPPNPYAVDREQEGGDHQESYWEGWHSGFWYGAAVNVIVFWIIILIGLLTTAGILARSWLWL